MKRRTLLVGLGTLTAGSGALLGSGAFSSVEARRAVSVETAGDDAALVQFVDATGGTYVTVDGVVVEIDVGDESAGVNRRARTTFEELLEISNGGTRDVERIEFAIEGENGENELLTPIPEYGYGGTGIDFPGDASVLTPDDDPVALGLAIELRESELDDPTVAAFEDGDIVEENFDPTLVVTVETDAGE